MLLSHKTRVATTGPASDVPSVLEAMIRRLLLSYGVEPTHLEDSKADWNAFARDWAKREGLAGHVAILVTGPSKENPDANSKMELLGLEAP